uniref:Major facilitator superfamily domain containing 4B n=1 Tax=Sinocyclocheilus grahami TaxID=75366 RepID=A0A672LUH5_SINGR
MAISVLGPTFEDLAVNVNKNISNLSYIFVGRSSGYIGGSLLGGILFDCMNPHLLLGFSLLITAFGMSGTPFCKKAWLLTVLMSGVRVPGVDKVPFISFKWANLQNQQGIKYIYIFILPSKEHHSNIHVSLHCDWCFCFIGVAHLLFAVLLQKAVLQTPQHTRIPAVLVLFFFYVGSEVAYGFFIFTYGKDYVGMKPVEAAGLNSLFWGTFAAGRGLAIFFAALLRNPPMLWVCTAIYGVSMSTTFPSGISWVEQYTTVTGRSAAVFVVGAALGEMVLPALLGLLLGQLQNQPLLMYLALGTSTFTSILFPVMYKIASPGGDATLRKMPGRHTKDADESEYQQALLDNAKEEEEQENESEADHWNDADF